MAETRKPPSARSPLPDRTFRRSHSPTTCSDSSPAGLGRRKRRSRHSCACSAWIRATREQAINLGQLYRQERKFQEAITAFRRAMEAAPYNATAAYGLANTPVSSAAGKTKAAKQWLISSGSARAATPSPIPKPTSNKGTTPKRSRQTGAAGARRRTDPDIAFTDASAMIPRGRAPTTAGGGDGSVATTDLDGDGDLDIVDSGAGGRSNVQERRRQVRRTSPPPCTLLPRPVRRPRSSRATTTTTAMPIWRSSARAACGSFAVTRPASPTSPPRRSWAHRWPTRDRRPGSTRTTMGTFDLFVAGSAGGSSADGAPAARLFRNNGTGRFTEVTKEAGLAVSGAVVAVVPTDYDNRRDIDVLVVRDTAPPLLFRNLRDGSFRDVALDVGLGPVVGAAMAAIGDVNKDGYPDFFFPRLNAAALMAMSDGRGRFTTFPYRWRPPTPAPPSFSTTTTMACSTSSCSPRGDRACCGTSAANGPM